MHRIYHTMIKYIKFLELFNKVIHILSRNLDLFLLLLGSRQLLDTISGQQIIKHLMDKMLRITGCNYENCQTVKFWNKIHKRSWDKWKLTRTHWTMQQYYTKELKANLILNQNKSFFNGAIFSSFLWIVNVEKVQ